MISIGVERERKWLKIVIIIFYRKGYFISFNFLLKIAGKKQTKLNVSLFDWQIASIQEVKTPMFVYFGGCMYLFPFSLRILVVTETKN